MAHDDPCMHACDNVLFVFPMPMSGAAQPPRVTNRRLPEDEADQRAQEDDGGCAGEANLIAVSRSIGSPSSGYLNGM